MHVGERPEDDAGVAVRTTVVVMTRNRRRSLARTLKRLQALPERPSVIVVDNGSDDGTATLVERAFPRVELIKLPENAGPLARTIGAQAAKTPYVAFADDDSWWRAGALAGAQAIFELHPRIALLAGRTLVGPEQRDDPINDAMRGSPLGRDPRLPGPSVLGFLACSSIVRRSAFLKVGGFRESSMGFEETLLAIELARRGWALVYADELVAEHHPEADRDDSARRRAHARNRILFAWRRRALRIAVVRTLRMAGDALTDRAVFRGLLDAACQAGRVRREREVVDEGLEASLRRLKL